MNVKALSRFILPDSITATLPRALAARFFKTQKHILDENRGILRLS